MTSRGENFLAFLKEAALKDLCNALAKEIYAKVFGVIVRMINDATLVEGLVDACGHLEKKFPTSSL